MTAAAPAIIPIREPEAEKPPEEVRRPNSGYQPPLFNEMPRVMPATVLDKPAPARKRGTRPAARRVDQSQQALEFVESPAPRVLPTSVESPIFCDARAARPGVRFVASCIDIALVGAAVGLFAACFRLITGSLPLDAKALEVAGGIAAALWLLYQALFCIAETETPGGTWMGLRVVDFDGKRPDRNARLQRLAASVISIVAVLGLLWSFFDEEHLAWHDLISKTFPTADIG